MSELTIAAVPASLIEVVWGQIIPLFDMVVEKSEDVSPDTTKQRLLDGNDLLITISDGSEIIAFNVLSVTVTDSGTRCLYIPITAGSRMDEWMVRFLEVSKQVGKDYNCTQLRGLACRDGWLRKLKKHGWTEVFTTIKCEIEG